MRTNLPHWQILQERGYFENHKKYKGLRPFGMESYNKINEHMLLDAEDNVIVIGCGYGRDVIQIAPYVGHVYGVDVSDVILDKARVFTELNGVNNFTGVSAQTWTDHIPEEVDLIFSIAVMQHLTRDLVKDYLYKSGIKLARGGYLMFQFIETSGGEHDAILKIYEPQIGWSYDQITKATTDAGLSMKAVETTSISAKLKCHWLIAQGT